MAPIRCSQLAVRTERSAKGAQSKCHEAHCRRPRNDEVCSDLPRQGALRSQAWNDKPTWLNFGIQRIPQTRAHWRGNLTSTCWPILMGATPGLGGSSFSVQSTSLTNALARGLGLSVAACSTVPTRTRVAE